jgi:hypothetical protein
MPSKTRFLKPIEASDEAREKGRKGGKKSGERRRELKTFRSLMETILRENSGLGRKNIQEMACRSVVNIIGSLNSTATEKIRAFEILLRLFGEWDSATLQHSGEIVVNDLSNLSDEKLIELAKKMQDKSAK